jgi:CHAD domain-containing protein
VRFFPSLKLQSTAMKSTPRDVSRAHDTAKLLRLYLKRQIATLQRRRALILSETAVEDVHKMRVAIRRLRCVLRSLGYENEPLLADARWAARRLGAVRDLDVIRLTHAGHKHPPNAAERRYLEHLEKRWLRARWRLDRCLRNKRLHRLITELKELRRALINDASLISHDARSATRAQLKKVKARGRNIGPGSGSRQLHRLRIECKRLRYLIELYGTMPETRLRVFETNTQDLLHLLGALQDERVALTHLRAYQAKLATGKASGDASDIRHKIDAHEKNIRTLRHRFPTVWRRFDDMCKARML